MIWAAALTASLAQKADAQQLELFVLDKFEWDMTKPAFEKAYMEKGFEWVSKAKSSARHSGSAYEMVIEKVKGKDKRVFKQKHPRIGKMDVGECIARFDGDLLARMDISIFNRGDNATLTEDQFEKKIEDFSALISKITGREAEASRQKSSAVRSKTFTWSGKTTRYMLEYSSQKGKNIRGGFLPEFISLKVAPSKKDQSLLEAVAEREQRVTATRETLLENVIKDESTGDVYIKNVPMVDQGSKGYCAVASAERVLRYYGLDVDQHEMAQISGASAGGGTDPQEMGAALKKVAGRLKVHLRVHEEMKDQEDLVRLIKDYDRLAKKNGKHVFDLPKRVYLNFVGCYQRFDAESLKSARLKGTDYTKFQEHVKESIDAGIPVLWSLFLGVFPEKQILQPSGGHMRLIIGYNMKTEELIYSDSWGAGHEKKRMKMDEGYAMTTGVRTLVPFR